MIKNWSNDAVQKSAIWEQMLMYAARMKDHEGMEKLLRMQSFDPLINDDKNYHVNESGLLCRTIDEMPFSEWDGIEWRFRICTGFEEYIGHHWIPIFE